MINDPADIEWLYTGLSTGSGQEIVGLSKTDYETVRAALESDTRRAKRAEAEAEALRAQLDAAVREVEGIFDSAAETELRLNATIDALRADLDAARFITDRLPPAGQYVEALVAAAWEPGVESAGRWRSPAYETLHVRGWRPTAPDDKEGQA